jgi:hypothetical protein
MTAAVRQRLRSVAADLRDGVLLDAVEARRIADALDHIAQGIAADVAFGLRLKPGQHHQRDQIAARDDLLREAAGKFWSASASEQSRQLSGALEKYRGGRWQRDRSAVECPYPPDKLAGYLWRVLRLRDRDIGERQMLRILTDATRF